MRVVMLSDLETRGGAAIAASRLAAGLAAEGHDVWRLVLWPTGGVAAPWRTVPLRGSLAGRAARRLRGRPRHVLIGALARRELRAALAALRPDVVNVHNLHGAADAGWSVRHVEVCAASAPTVWTLHDTWSFTGRCAYPGPCTKFHAGCDAGCPTPEEYPPLDPRRIGDAWRERREVLASATNLVAVTPSRWLAERAREGLWSPRRVEVIPYDLPLDVFRPHDRAEARRALGLDATGRVVLACAQHLDDRRKGLDLLQAALPRVSADPLTVLLMGGGAPWLDPGAGVRVVALGPVDDPSRQALVYSAADVLVHPAREDNLPNTVLEAIACGTPVVAFPVGGLPEQVLPGRTGWLAEAVDADALGRALDAALRDPGLQDLRASCRAVAEAEWGAGTQARRYVELFRGVGGG